MTCPHCDGKGGHAGLGCGPAGCGMVTLPCPPCGSTGQVPDELGQRMLTWREDGRKLRALRVDGEPYRSLRAEADRRGLTVVELSQMERGVIEPVFP